MNVRITQHGGARYKGEATQLSLNHAQLPLPACGVLAVGTAVMQPPAASQPVSHSVARLTCLIRRLGHHWVLSPRDSFLSPASLSPPSPSSCFVFQSLPGGYRPSHSRDLQVGLTLAAQLPASRPTHPQKSPFHPRWHRSGSSMQHPPSAAVCWPPAIPTLSPH